MLREDVVVGVRGGGRRVGESELGELMSGGLPDPLEAAARALGVNEVSEIVRTDEGVQLLLRTA